VTNVERLAKLLEERNRVSVGWRVLPADPDAARHRQTLWDLRDPGLEAMERMQAKRARRAVRAGRQPV
jgi:hypothetical protein